MQPRVGYDVPIRAPAFEIPLGNFPLVVSNSPTRLWRQTRQERIGQRVAVDDVNGRTGVIAEQADVAGENNIASLIPHSRAEGRPRMIGRRCVALEHAEEPKPWIVEAALIGHPEMIEFPGCGGCPEIRASTERRRGVEPAANHERSRGEERARGG